MILYTPQPYEAQQRLRTIKCPQCKHGKVCDVPRGSKTRTVQSLQSVVGDEPNGIYIKCQKCSKYIVFATAADDNN